MTRASSVSTRSRIGILIYGMVNAVLFGLGLVIVLTVPSLSERAFIAIPVVILASILLAWPIAWFIAPRLRKPVWQRRRLAAEGQPVGTPDERRALAEEAPDTTAKRKVDEGNKGSSAT